MLQKGLKKRLSQNLSDLAKFKRRAWLFPECSFQIILLRFLKVFFFNISVKKVFSRWPSLVGFGKEKKSIRLNNLRNVAPKSFKFFSARFGFVRQVSACKPFKMIFIEITIKRLFSPLVCVKCGSALSSTQGKLIVLRPILMRFHHFLFT